MKLEICYVTERGGGEGLSRGAKMNVSRQIEWSIVNRRFDVGHFLVASCLSDFLYGVPLARAEENLPYWRPCFCTIILEAERRTRVEMEGHNGQRTAQLE